MHFIISLLFILFPILSILLVFLGLIFDEKHQKLYSVLFIIFISLILFYLVPDYDMDLYRYYSYMSSVSEMNFSYFFSNVISKSEPLAYLLMFVFAKTGCNQLLMIFTTIVSYSILFYIYFDYIKIKKISKISRSVILIFFLSTFLVIANITGLRLCLARLIFFLALYLDMFKNRKNIWVYILYILPIFIHTSSLILICLKLFLVLSKNKYGFKDFFMLALLTLSPSFLINVTNKLVNIPFLSTLSSKAEIYLSGYYSGLSNIYMLYVATLIFMFIVTLYAKKTYKNLNLKFLNYSLMILTIAILYINKSAIATRFIFIAITNFVILCMDIFKESKKNKAILSIGMMALSTVYLIYQVILFKDVVGYGDLFSNGLLNNIFSLFLWW